MGTELCLWLPVYLCGYQFVFIVITSLSYGYQFVFIGTSLSFWVPVCVHAYQFIFMVTSFSFLVPVFLYDSGLF